MKFRPLQDRVLVKRLETEDKTSGGIILPEASKEKPMQGEVISVGSGYVSDTGVLRALDVKSGDVVMFAKWSGTEIKVDNVDYLVMKESDIIGIVE